MACVQSFEVVKAMLDGAAWVWTGESFAQADTVALAGPLNLAPYMHVVPSDIASFSDLLRALGVRCVEICVY